MHTLLTLFTPSVCAELLALAAAWGLLRRRMGWQGFKWFLLFVVLAETAGWLLGEVLMQPDNVWVYNLLLLVFIPFLYLRLSEAPGLHWLQKAVPVCVALYACGWLTCALWLQRGQFYSHLLVGGSLLLLAAALFFFFTIITTDHYPAPLRSEYFWLAAGVAFYAAAALLNNLFRATLLEMMQRTGVNYYRLVNDIFSNLLYPCLAAAFLCRNLKYRLTTV